MRYATKAIILLCLILIACNGLYGCKGGGATPKVGDIEGPDMIWETTWGYFIMHYSGTNVTYQWSVDPSIYGYFTKPTEGTTQFVAAEVPYNTDIKIRCLISADQWEPVLKIKDVLLQDITGFFVSEIDGPIDIEEYSTSDYKVLSAGDSGIKYQWSVEPISAGSFDNPATAETKFMANGVTTDTSAIIRVFVTSDHYNPSWKTLPVTIRDTPGLIVGDIIGPAQVNENTDAYYSVTASGDTGITYAWSVNPPTVGNFDNPAAPSVKFTAGNVTGDTPIQISVIVNSDHYDPVTKDRAVTIIAESPFAWAGPWGGTSIDEGRGVAVDSLGNTYVTGEFRGNVDFDPGFGIQTQSSEGLSDAYLSKFNTMGDLMWVRTWGGHYSDGGRDVAVDLSFNVYVTGYYRYSADFHPGPWGEDIHYAMGDDDAYLTKFDTYGNFQWADTWGGSDRDHGLGVDVSDSGDVYVTGYFENIVDFDPSEWNIDNHTSSGASDAFLSRFSSSGNYSWGKTWGDADYDVGYGVAVSTWGNPYVTGHFEGTVDFDPGSGTDTHSSNGDMDVYLTYFNSSGVHDWARTWGGIDNDSGQGVCYDTGGNVLVTGCFENSVDFDPGAGSDMHTASGPSGDAFVSSLDASGNYNWAETWGGIGEDCGFSVDTDGSGNAYITGFFNGEIQYDFGSGNVSYPSIGLDDGFLVIYDTGGNPRWAGTWGGSGEDAGYGVALNTSGDVFITGIFSGYADLDPTSGADNYSSHGMYDAYLIKLYAGNFF